MCKNAWGLDLIPIAQWKNKQTLQKVKSKAADTDTEAAPSYSEDLAKITIKDDNTK